MTSAAAKKAWESRRRHRGVVHTKINGGRHGKRVAARRENRKRVKHHPGLSSLDKSPNKQKSIKRGKYADLVPKGNMGKLFNEKFFETLEQNR